VRRGKSHAIIRQQITLIEFLLRERERDRERERERERNEEVKYHLLTQVTSDLQRLNIDNSVRESNRID